MNSHRLADLSTRKISQICWVLSIFVFMLLAVGTAHSAENPFYDKSYAIVIGVDKYSTKKFNPLPFTVEDAKAFGTFLQREGFSVTFLTTGEETTRTRIVTEIQKLARLLKPDDRVVIYYSGHGYSQRIGDEDFGYIIPSDGSDESATYISMEELRALSRMLGTAKHQLFILDACFSGLIGMKESTVSAEKVPYPNYLQVVTRNAARQYLTAGGSEQRARAVGPRGHSYFTAYLLEGLLEGKADKYPDGYITFVELADYLQVRASNVDQTPRYGVFEKHGQGEFVFVSPKGSQIASVSEVDGGQGRRSYKSGSDVGYGSIRISSDFNGRVVIDKKEKKWIYTSEEQEYLKLPEGEHEVVVIGGKGTTITKKVMVQEGQVTPLRISNKKSDKNTPVGSIRVFNLEKEKPCKVYIDKEYVGDLAPNEEKDYTANVGEHRVEIHFAEDILSKELLVAENKISALRLRIIPPTGMIIIH